jgi:glucosamine-phosphate N-acetyltransferase
MRPLEDNDYRDGYMELMYEFTNYKYEIDENAFISYIRNNNIKIIVIYSTTEKKIVGAGSIFRIEKLHNNPIGQIEDVIITEKYRGSGLGRILVNKLIEIGKNVFNCYKITLNCLDKNVDFYKKCNFEISGNQMKYF